MRKFLGLWSRLLESRTSSSRVVPNQSYQSIHRLFLHRNDYMYLQACKDYQNRNQVEIA